MQYLSLQVKGKQENSYLLRCFFVPDDVPWLPLMVVSGGGASALPLPGG
jgi:hypothetical protein